ncbi:dienelactone hydrolase family protein [Pendulispora albinea]|uniref:Alpha/beta fold hydrolase n=1 Tax=Pendulispora albinea TaxID=2741071 RepID=A0ABZ2MC08_9BACT
MEPTVRRFTFEREDGPVTESRELVSIRAGDVRLEGELASSRTGRGLVIFAHGSGSSRHSPRNRFVAQALRTQGRVATLLFDLLSAGEGELDARTGHLRFDIDLLAERLVAVTDWALARRPADATHIGYFGASTGAAAALVAAAARPDRVAAVVSRGGRPDLARGSLERVHAPTLLIVGGEDPTVAELNRDAMKYLHAETRLDIIDRASHLFEEPGALDEAARRAAGWFQRFFV